MVLVCGTSGPGRIFSGFRRVKILIDRKEIKLNEIIDGIVPVDREWMIKGKGTYGSTGYAAESSGKAS